RAVADLVAVLDRAGRRAIAVRAATLDVQHGARAVPDQPGLLVARELEVANIDPRRRERRHTQDLAGLATLDVETDAAVTRRIATHPHVADAHQVDGTAGAAKIHAGQIWQAGAHRHARQIDLEVRDAHELVVDDDRARHGVAPEQAEHRDRERGR